MLGASIPLLLVVLVARRGMRQLQAARAYREVAHLLGLEVDTRGISLHGVLAGRPLWVGEVMVGHGPERRTEAHAVIGLRRSLGLGVEIHPRRRRARRVVGVPLGDPELDRHLVASARWPEGLRRVLEGGASEALVGTLDHAAELHLTDDQLRLRLRREPSRAATLVAMVEQIERVAEALEAARYAIAPPEELQRWVEPWSLVADQLDLGLVPSLPALQGRFGDHLVEVSPEWREGGWRARICVMFDPHEITGLRLDPQQAPDGYQHVGQDIQIGDPEFDEAFVIKGFDPQDVRARLSSAVRASILELTRHGALSLTDHRLCLSGTSGDPRDLIELLPRVRRVADAVAPPPASAPRWIEQR